MKIGAIKDWVKTGENAIFGEIRLKPMQIAIVKCNKKHDVLVNLPTGFGKSLLFQYPAAQLHNKCIIVFVPLKALLWDCLKQAQLHNLTSSECDSKFVRNYYDHNVLPQLLFLTPERLFQNKSVMSFIQYLHENQQIQMFVIDQAHCISEWGSDFRPDYAKLNQIKSMYPGVRVLGMSATIPPQALKDLVAKLQIVGCYYFQSSSNRPNLIYEVMSTQKSKVAASVIEYIRQKNLKKQSGIIYCQTIKNAEQVYKELTKSYDFDCCLFHSKLSQRQREQNFDRFMGGQVKCIVATICFGMGVNKKNIRFVINVGISLSAENYYQESGRAGRDGLISFCLLLTYKSDDGPLKYLICQSTKRKILQKRKLFKLDQLKVYTKVSQCRKRALFKLLGQQFSAEECKKTCDFCQSGGIQNIKYQQVDYSQKGFYIIEQMQRYRQNFTKIQLISFLKGRDVVKNKVMKQRFKKIFQYLKNQKNQIVQLLVQTMIAKGLLIPYTERIKFGKMKRFVQYLKPCTKSALQREKYIKLQVKHQINPRIKAIVPPNNPNVSKTFQKYLKIKSKSIDKCQFQVQFQKKQPQKLLEQDQDLREIKMVQMGPEQQKFLGELFSQDLQMSKDYHSQDIREEYNQQYLQKFQEQFAQVIKEDEQTQLENPYLQQKMLQSKMKQKKSAKKQDTIIYQQKKDKILKLDEQSDDSMLEDLIKRKREEIASKSQKQNKQQRVHSFQSADDILNNEIRRKIQLARKKNQEQKGKIDVVVRKKLIQKFQFL